MFLILCNHYRGSIFIKNGCGTYFGVCVIVGSESVLAYITTMGKIFGWDLRSQEVAWKLSTMPKYGNILIM